MKTIPCIYIEITPFKVILARDLSVNSFTLVDSSAADSLLYYEGKVNRDICDVGSILTLAIVVHHTIA